MADGFIRVPVDSTGKILDCSELTVGINIVERQRIVLADSGNAAALANIMSTTPVGTEQGLVVRTIPSGTQTITGTVVINSASTGVLTNVVSTTTSTTLLSSNPNRKGLIIYNDSTQVLYISLSSNATSTTSYTVQIAPQGLWQMPNPVNYTGAVTGIWTTANGNARVTELS